MFKRCCLLLLLPLTAFISIYGQDSRTLFKIYKIEELKQNRYGDILVAKDGIIFVSASEFTFAILTGGNMGAVTIGLDNQDYGIKNLESIFSGTPIKTMTESSDGFKFFATAGNQVTYCTYAEPGVCDIPPFYFPVKGDEKKDITKLWFDSKDNLFIGTHSNAFYMVSNITPPKLDSNRYRITHDAAGMMRIERGEIPVQKITLLEGNNIFCFGESIIDKNIIWLGTDMGLQSYDMRSGVIKKILQGKEKITVTHIEPFSTGDIWFSTLEKGMGVYHKVSGITEFFPSNSTNDKNYVYPIRDFCIRSPGGFLLAIKDSFPATFNIADRSYRFITDPAFTHSKNNCTQIKMDTAGNFYLINNGMLYSSNISNNPEWLGGDSLNMAYTPLIYGITDFDNKEIASYVTDPSSLKNLTLKYNQNSIIIYLTSNYFSGNKKIQYEWRLDGDVSNWVQMPAYSISNDSSTRVELPDLKPGKYLFRARVKVGSGDWSNAEAQMQIIVKPAFWATWWFWTIIAVGLIVIVYTIVHLRVRAVRRAEKLKLKYEKDLLELEAKALRAQMNPHFIFNCMNSIKSLIQTDDKPRSIEYLTTFSKLIRTLFQNSDKRQITLYDEIETCRLYTQLEAMRLGGKLKYSFNIDPDLDLKSVMVPALIIQPFIENAIWHGIVPKGQGKISISVARDNDRIICKVDDDGIGREISILNKKSSVAQHESKGIHLSQARLDLEKLLNETNASIETIDKYENNQPDGTKVILTFSLN